MGLLTDLLQFVVGLLGLTASVKTVLSPYSPRQYEDIYTLVGATASSPTVSDTSVKAAWSLLSRYASPADTDAVALLVPNSLTDTNWLGIAHNLKAFGIPFYYTTALATATQSPVVILYTGFSGTVSTSDANSLSSFVNRGGNLITFSNVPSSLSTIFGVTSVNNTAVSTKRSALQFLSSAAAKVDPSAVDVDWTDWPAESTFSIWSNVTQSSLKHWGYQLTTSAPATPLAQYWIYQSNTTSINDTSTSRYAATVKKTGTGSAYAFGVNLGDFYFRQIDQQSYSAPYYVGKYYPGIDLITRRIKHIYRNAAQNKWFNLAQVPYNKGLLFLTTADIDTSVSIVHGVGMAAAAYSQGAAMNFFHETKYVSDVYEQAFHQLALPYLRQLAGFPRHADGTSYVEIGSHSVSHSPNVESFGLGSPQVSYQKGKNTTTKGYAPFIDLCSDSAATSTVIECVVPNPLKPSAYYTYGGSTYGEAKISQFLLNRVLSPFNRTVTAYRPGHLYWHNALSQVLAAHGFKAQSAGAANQFMTHQPIHTTHNRENFQELDLYEWPLSFSDGDGNMSSSYFPGSDLQKQYEVTTKIARTGGQYTLLIHPSDIMIDKIQFQLAFHQLVKPFSWMANITGANEYWRTRDLTNISQTYASTTKATLSVQVPGRVNGLTIQVPFTWTLSSLPSGITGCQAPTSYDNRSSAIVINAARSGTYDIPFTRSTSSATLTKASVLSNMQCATDLYQPVVPSCVPWDVRIIDFQDLWFYYKAYNSFILDTESENLAYNYTADGRANFTTPDASTGSLGTRNYWYTDIAQFTANLTLYTHLVFQVDMPTNSNFLVQLSSNDTTTNTRLPSKTFLNVNDYVVPNGFNKTVSIPFADFQGQALETVVTITFSNFWPPATSFYIDNVKVSRRCQTVPDDETGSGLAIDSLYDVDRFASSINDLGGWTGDDDTMASLTLPVMNMLQLLPNNTAESYYFNRVAPGSSQTLDASAFTNLELVMAAPAAGATFEISLISGSATGPSANVSSSTIATLAANQATRLIIPLTRFTGIDLTRLYVVRLQKFSVVGQTWTMQYLSFTPGVGVPLGNTTCATPPGTVINNHCNAIQYSKSINELGLLTSDDFSAADYHQVGKGVVGLTPKAGAYWYTVVGTSAAPFDATQGDTATALQIGLRAPPGSSFTIVFKQCSTSSSCVATSTVSTASSLFLVFDGTWQTLIVPFASVQELLPKSLISVTLSGFTNYAEHQLSYVSFVSGSAMTPSVCPTCTGVVVNTWCRQGAALGMNRLGGTDSDDSTLIASTITPNGRLQLTPKTGSYYYNLLSATSGGTYSAGTNNALQLSVRAPAGARFTIKILTTVPNLNDPIATFAISTSELGITFDGTALSTVTVPFYKFPIIDATKLYSITLEGFSPLGATYDLGCISFTQVVVPSNLCTACTGTAVLDYCVHPVVNQNALGAPASDDGSGVAVASIVNGVATFVPSNADAYWYTFVSASADTCFSASSFTTLTLKVGAPARSHFNVSLRSKSGTCTAGDLTNSVSVSTAEYATFTGVDNLQTFTIPLTAFTGSGNVYAGALHSVALSEFSEADGQAAYAIACISFSKTTQQRRMVLRSEL
ncbi:hypothetical protein CXG81DRAFT_11290 [Caulochytrium protostelioides]|uniref:Gingipain domain-containing protein n=1 Tax=Caulochytrium protostelioides TaxID=1555241 RepID=A0A4P9XA81_9FUNG|nr:hypothetical protein CXG81DRAFT_11290 [Caulochytrium protostelioides]|eukprot:RKP02020.1 hypothetical protein CXG81DRAFT_11290 [Caulochytrium protostelioides]